MNLFASFRKPAWQSGNASKRASAVVGDADAELVTALPRLALEDESVEVRRAALRRCDDPQLYGRAAKSEVDAELRLWARQRWLAALTSGRIVEPADADLSALTDAECESLAAGAKAPDLRRRLLARSQRPAFLVERAISDSDPAIRFSLVERIDTPALLDRIAEKARKSDKRLARAAKERAEQLRLSAGDTSARQRRAEQIADAAEALMRDAGDRQQRAAGLERLEQEWAALTAAELPAGLVARFEGAAHVVRAQLAPPAAVSLPEPMHEPASPQGAAPAEAAAPTPEEIAAQARLQAEVAANAERAAREKALEDERRRAEEARRSEESKRLSQLADALSAGDTATARSLAAALDPALLSPGERRKWNGLQSELKKFEGWEHWASNKVRARLCEQVEALVGSGLHPDALATRVRELQQEWRALDQAEGRGADAEPSGLDKRFRVAVARALKPARGFFKKRDELRDEQQQSLRKFLDEARAQLGDAGEDTTALMALQRSAVDRLRELDRLGHGERRAVAGELRTLLDDIQPRLTALFEQREAERDALIAAAKRLGGETDGRKIAAQARELSQRWKAIGKGRTGKDQQQWREFRAALDQVFAGLDERRQQVEQARAEITRQAEALLGELETLAALEGDALSSSQAQLRELRDRWQALSPVDRALAERYDTALTRHRDALARQELTRRRDRYLAAIVSGAPPAESTDAEASDAALALVFEAESLAEIEAPEHEREQRRRWQLERLQQRMRGETGAPGADVTEQLLARWREVRGLSAADRDRLAERLSRAIERLLERT